MSPMENQFYDLENRFWQALQDNDARAAAELTDEPCIVTGAQGVASINRHALEAMMAAANYTLDTYELRDVQVKLLGSEVAIVAYQVHEDLTVDGKKVHLDAADASTWVRRDGKWLCALHTESLAGDPFGRDRTQ